jgi:hypothetical protein
LERVKLLKGGDTSLDVFNKIGYPPYSYYPITGKKAGEFFGYFMVYSFFQGEGSNLYRDKLILLTFTKNERLRCISAQNIPELETSIPCH